jgi:tetratricopeptide (TPR) repeat protein
MHATAITSRFLTGYSSKARFADAEGVVSIHGLLDHFVTSHLIRTVHSRDLLLKLTNHVILLAEQAFLMRDLDQLEEMSRILTNLPVDAARQAGLYYHALAIKRKGSTVEAQTLFETVADNVQTAYSARAIQGLGAHYLGKGRLNDALRLQLEALRASSDTTAHGLQTMLMAHWDIAIVRSLAGDHKGALGCFERLRPLVCQVAKRLPFYFYKYHNALAVELGEIGRIEEATAASKIALASPFAPAYPEWSETRDEIAARRTAATPSVVSIGRPAATTPSPQAEAVHLRQGENQRKPKRSSELIFSWPINRTHRLRSIVPMAATAAITRVAQSILERIRICIGPRAPPALA